MREAVTTRGLVQRNAPRGKILLVDEDLHDLQVYTVLLREQGHVVECCVTYLEAAERLEGERYDLIIMSQKGQTFDGQPLLERAIEIDRRRPVLVLTRSLDRRSYVDSMYLGARDYLEKPAVPGEILKTVSNCLSYRLVAA